MKNILFWVCVIVLPVMLLRFFTTNTWRVAVILSLVGVLIGVAAGARGKSTKGL